VFRDDAPYHRVVAVGQHGRAVHEREGQTLLFLEKHLGDVISTPKLYGYIPHADQRASMLHHGAVDHGAVAW
jgi:hypothetical protein